MDWTKCNDEQCPMKEQCYRYTSKASEWQSYFINSPREWKECYYKIFDKK